MTHKTRMQKLGYEPVTVVHEWRSKWGLTPKAPANRCACGRVCINRRKRCHTCLCASTAQAAAQTEMGRHVGHYVADIVNAVRGA